MIKRPIPLLSVYWNENDNHKIASGDRLVSLKDRGKKKNDKASIYYYFFKKTTFTIILQKIIDGLTIYNNLIFMIYCKNITDIIFISFLRETREDKVMINYYYGDLNFFFNKIYVRPHCENR